MGGANHLVDSREGIAKLIAWAEAHCFVLNREHERIAKKWDVPTDGVIISRLLP